MTNKAEFSGVKGVLKVARRPSKWNPGEGFVTADEDRKILVEGVERSSRYYNLITGQGSDLFIWPRREKISLHSSYTRMSE